MSERKKIPEELVRKIFIQSRGVCCICQTRFIQIHHIDGDPSNNNEDNLIPLCPNCHNQAESRGGLSRSYSPDRLKAIRNWWYTYCEERKKLVVSGDNEGNKLAILRLKTFANTKGTILGYAPIGWGKTFGFIKEEFTHMNRDSIIEMLFSTTNPVELETYLQEVRGMYLSILRNDKDTSEEFRKSVICSEQNTMVGGFIWCLMTRQPNRWLDESRVYGGYWMRDARK